MVRFFNPALTYRKIKPEIDAAIHDVLSRGDLILRKDVDEFEESLANYVGTTYAVGLNSGTDALLLSLKALDIKAGDEVITVSNTFKATVTAIKAVGARPVLIDIGDDYLMDPRKIHDALTPRTRAIIPVHLSGDVCDMQMLSEAIISRPDVQVIEDAAQALGGEFMGRKAGSFGVTGCFSFYPAKILGSFGDAGAITTNDKDVYEWVKNYRNHCKDTPGEDGMNSRLDNLQAAVLNVRFKYMSEILNKRHSVAERYSNGLRNTPLVLPVERPGRVWQDYIVRSEERNVLSSFLKMNSIETMIPPTLPHQELNIPAVLPKSEKYNEQYLRLPCNPEMTDEEVSTVIQKINEFYEV